jgi:hypothetical protein
MVKCIIIGLVAGLLSFQAEAQTPDALKSMGPAPSRNAVVTANLSGSGPTIPANFIGLSGEVGDFTNGYYQGTTGSAASFINLAKLLGSNGIFRLGGLSSDTSALATVNSTQANNIAAFLTQIGGGWSLIYGLCGVCSNSGLAATQATSLASAMGTANVIFQYTNEPIDGSHFTVSAFQTMWNSYDSAVKTAVSGAKSAAWDDGNWGQTQTAINGLTGGVSGLSLLTQHWYPYCKNDFSTPQPGALISAVYSFGFTGNITYAGATAIRVTETNSLCGSGQLGMSDRMMSATWFLNAAMQFAKFGFAGINVHSHFGWFQTPQGAAGVYNAFVQQADNGFSPGPIFYGMLLFSKIGGQQIIPFAIGGNNNIEVIATKGGNGNANIIAVNNDVFSPVTVTPAQSSAWTTANVLLVKDADGAGCASANPIIGGQAIGESGSWSGTSTSLANGASVAIPPCGAALIQIQP